MYTLTGLNNHQLPKSQVDLGKVLMEVTGLQEWQSPPTTKRKMEQKGYGKL